MKKIIMVGSIGAAVIIILAMFPAIVSAQTITHRESNIKVIQNIREKFVDKLQMSDGFISDLFFLLTMILWLIFANPGAP